MNNVTNEEYVLILSTLESIHEENFNCHRCMNQYSKRPDYANNKEAYDKSLNTIRRKKGCEGPGISQYKVENIKYSICIGNFYSHSVYQYVDLYYNYQRGVMPFAGSIMEQPCKIIEVFNIIDGFIKGKQLEAHNKELSKQKAKSNGRR